MMMHPVIEQTKPPAEPGVVHLPDAAQAGGTFVELVLIAH